MNEQIQNTMKERKKNYGISDYDGGHSIDAFHSKHRVSQDIKFLEQLLPYHYLVREDDKDGSVRCVSKIGIKVSNTVDTEDVKEWKKIFSAIKKQFGKRFQEVYHHTCSLHKDFTIYLKTDAQRTERRTERRNEDAQ